MKNLLFIAMVGMVLALLAGFLGRFHPAPDSFSHFRLHLSVILALVTIIWALCYRRAAILVFLLPALFGIAGSMDGLPRQSARAAEQRQENLYRLFSMNLLWNNPTPGKVFAAIDGSDPDFLFLTEFSSQWEGRVASFLANYPFSYRCGGLLGGSMILSKYPLETDSDYCGPRGGLARTTVLLDGKKIALGAIHLHWPWPGPGPIQVIQLAPQIAKLGPHAIIAGDYNAASWSAETAKLHEPGELELVAGIGPSWGPSLRMGGSNLQWPQWLGLPIDNAAAKGAVKVVAARRLDPAGSDHLPLLIDFVVRP